MRVQQLWIRLPKNFNLSNFDKFYKSLGTNIPQYQTLEGSGLQYELCTNENVDIQSICEKFGIIEYSISSFITEKEKFNSNYQIKRSNTKSEYILELYRGY